MKFFLKKKQRYIPKAYKDKLIDKLFDLKQWASYVGDYVDEFERLHMLCDIVEDGMMTIARFRDGLRLIFERGCLEKMLKCTWCLQLHFSNRKIT